MGCPSEGETGPIEDAGEPRDESFDGWRVTIDGEGMAGDWGPMETEDLRGGLVIFERPGAGREGDAGKGDRRWAGDGGLVLGELRGDPGAGEGGASPADMLRPFPGSCTVTAGETFGRREGAQYRLPDNMGFLSGSPEFPFCGLKGKVSVWTPCARITRMMVWTPKSLYRVLVSPVVRVAETDEPRLERCNALADTGTLSSSSKKLPATRSSALSSPSSSTSPSLLLASAFSSQVLLTLLSQPPS